MAGQEYKQRAEYKQIWPIYIGILTETSQNPQKQALKICLKSACIPSFSLMQQGVLPSNKGAHGLGSQEARGAWEPQVSQGLQGAPRSTKAGLLLR